MPPTEQELVKLQQEVERIRRAEQADDARYEYAEEEALERKDADGTE